MTDDLRVAIPTSHTSATPAQEHLTHDMVALRHSMQARISAFRALPWGVRAVMIILLVQSLAGALVIATRALPQPMLDAYEINTTTYAQMPTIAFWVSLVFWVLGWSFVLAAALSSHWFVRFAALGLFSYLANELLDSYSGQYVPLIPLAALWVWALVLTIFTLPAFRNSRLRKRITLRTNWVVVFVLIALQFGLYALREFSQTYQDDIPVTLISQAVDLSTLLVVVMVLSGSDWAEMSLTLATRFASGVRSVRRPWLLPTLTLVVALGLAVYWLLALHVLQFPALVSIVAVFVTLVGYLVLWVLPLAVTRTLPSSLPPVGRIAGSVVATAALIIVGIAFVAPRVAGTVLSTANDAVGHPIAYDFAIYHHPEPAPTFSLSYPTDWTVTTSQVQAGSDLAQIAFKNTQGFDQAMLIGIPMATVTGFNATTEDAWEIAIKQVCSDCQIEELPIAPHNGWVAKQVVFTTGKYSLPGYSWMRVSDDEVWTLTGYSDTQEDLAYDTPYFTAMIDSFRTDLTARQPSNPGVFGILLDIERFAPGNAVAFGLLPMGVCLCIGVALILLARRRRAHAGSDVDAPITTGIDASSRGNVAQANLAAWGIFLIVAGLMLGFTYLPGLISAARQTAPHMSITTAPSHTYSLGLAPVLTVPALQMVCAVTTIFILLVLIGRRQVSTHTNLIWRLLVLNISLQVLHWILSAFSATDAVAVRFTVLQGVLLVVALLWDLITTGFGLALEAPRTRAASSRFLLFAGYSMVSGVLVLCASVLPTSTGAFANQTTWTTYGGLILGFGLILTVFLVNRERPRASTATVAAATPNGTVAQSTTPAE